MDPMECPSSREATTANWRSISLRRLSISAILLGCFDSCCHQVSEEKDCSSRWMGIYLPANLVCHSSTPDACVTAVVRPRVAAAWRGGVQANESRNSTWCTSEDYFIQSMNLRAALRLAPAIQFWFMINGQRMLKEATGLWRFSPNEKKLSVHKWKNVHELEWLSSV